MAFDPKIHEVKFLIIKCGQLLFPEENNITELYSRASRALGVPEIITTSVSANQMPAPHEMTDPDMLFHVRIVQSVARRKRWFW